MIDPLSLQNRVQAPVFPNRGLALTQGEGVYLRDVCGRRYLDFTSGYGVAIFGHGHPFLTATLAGQLARLTVLHGSFANDVRAEAQAALLERCGGGLARVHLSSSGAEANEAALKFAVLTTGQKRFVACRGGYHGKTLGALAATDGAKYRAPFEPLPWDFDFVPYGDIVALDEALDGRTAGFIVEPIQGESGVRPAPTGYLSAAAAMCKARGALLIIDEIQTGTGRTGAFLASAAEVSSFDIVTLGKGLAGGIPIGATLVSKPVAASIGRGSHTSTFSGSPLAAAGIKAVLDLLDEGLLGRVREIGTYFQRALDSIRSPLIKDVRGRGLMIGVEIDGRRDDILKALQKAGLLAIPAGDDVVRFLPPYLVEKAQVDEAAAMLQNVVAAFEKRGVVDACAGS
jgi:acetylornithine/LysW-gamma-L-lysine aminotransferase